MRAGAEGRASGGGFGCGLQKAETAGSESGLDRRQNGTGLRGGILFLRRKNNLRVMAYLWSLKKDTDFAC